VKRLAAVFVLAQAAAACTGHLQGESPGFDQNPNGETPGTAGSSGVGTGGSSTVDPNQPPTGQVKCAEGATDTVGHRVLRRLTNGELEQTIRATFGFDAATWAGVNLPSDAGSHDGFTNNVDSLTVGPDYAKGTFDGGKKIAALVATDAELAKLVPCAAQGDRACAATFVDTIGSKLYRRPVTTAEKERYLALFDKIKAKEDFKSFAYWATTALLQSPHLIYRSEVGEADGARFKLTPYEVATELSYTFTGGPPSAALTQLAASGQLATADQIEAAARNLVYDGQSVRPEFKTVMLRFADQWLALGGLSNLKKDATLYPDFSADVQASMGEETRRFFSSVVLEEKGSVATLLTAPYTYVDSALSSYYGFGAGSGDFQRVMRPDTWGVGLLAQGAMLAVQANAQTSSPTRRGYLIRTRVLCGVVPPPPPVIGEIPAPSAAKTTRQRYEELHTANPSCKSCHSLMDAIGFSFEHFDSAGRYRQTENDNPINAQGILAGTTSGDVTVNGQAELATALSKLPEVTECVSSYLGAYALGLNHDSAECLVNGPAEQLKAGGSMLDFYVAMARSEHFRARQ
jgi:hypothetical protein